MDMHVCMCGKSFKSHSGLKTHERACIEYNSEKVRSFVYVERRK